MAGATVPRDRILAIAFSVVALVALYLFLKKTASDWPWWPVRRIAKGSFLKGINRTRCPWRPWVLGALCRFGRRAGRVHFAASPLMGGEPMINGLVTIVLGGLGSIPEPYRWPASWSHEGYHPGFFGQCSGLGGASLVVVILVLLFRPMGFSAMTKHGPCESVKPIAARRYRDCRPDAQHPLGQQVLADRAHPGGH